MRFPVGVRKFPIFAGIFPVALAGNLSSKGALHKKKDGATRGLRQSFRPEAPAARGVAGGGLESRRLTLWRVNHMGGRDRFNVSDGNSPNTVW